jgi:pimeloyl-ACP methyl ester carboxylesterase
MPSWVSGLIAPTTSPRLRSEILWEYSQAGPGVYHGDCYFYAFEMPEIARELGPARCPLYVLSDEYDYSATPAMSEHAARQLDGKFILMEKMGHFAMSEEPERFARYVGAIVDELAHVRTESP